MKATTTIASSETPDGSTLLLQEHDGHYYLRVNGITLMATTASESEQKMAEVACTGIESAKPRILIGGLGFGYTLRSVLNLVPSEAQVIVAELLPDIVEWNRTFLQDINGAMLDDPRTKIKTKDVHELIKKGRYEPYDAILLDVDNSPDPLVQRNNSRLYSRNGIERIFDALKPQGCVVFWSAHRDPSFKRLLDGQFGNVDCIPAKAYPKAKKFTHTLFVSKR